jgi:hypothetical protein
MSSQSAATPHTILSLVTVGSVVRLLTLTGAALAPA